ncbi:MAG: response regulator [Burkholderiales bacterium]|nr:response regulator [Burkholderiales bacterium]
MMNLLLAAGRNGRLKGIRGAAGTGVSDKMPFWVPIGPTPAAQPLRLAPMTPADPQSSARAKPLRMRLLLLAASGLLPLLIVLAWGLSYLLDDREAIAKRSMVELSRALATAVDAEHKSIAALLEQMSTSDELEQADLRAFHMAAQRAAQQLGWRRVVLTDAEGRVLLRSGDEWGKSSPVPLEPGSIAQVVATRAAYVSRVVETPSQSADAFAVRVPVLRSGKLVYVLSAVLPTDRIVSVLTRQNIPAGSVASVFDQANHRVARSVKVASPFPTPSLQALLDSGAQQGAGRTNTREGIENYTGFTRLKDSGWAVVAGTSVADANQGLYALLRALGLGLAASLSLAVLLAWLLSRNVLGPIEALKKGAAALGRGDPVSLPALNIVELDDVAVALTDAAADRDRAAARATDALRVAEEANRSKDQFLAMLGHELRNPLAPISTAVQLMAMRGDGSTEHERRIIERQLSHVTRLVDDLLDVSRITSGRLSIQREPVRLAPVLAQVVENIRPSLNGQVLSLELAPGLEDLCVAGDEVRLSQVFNNLLVNAVKFTRAGDPITVNAAVEGNEIRVDVHDGGTGMVAADLEHIFELFYQAPQSTDRARGGLGLGLPIVRSLVDMHGGKVDADSDGAGQGSCFTVRLPLGEAPPAVAQSAAVPVARGAGNVLVVDDNADAADTCAALLQMTGYEVRVAYTPEAALQALRDFTPGVAILDIGLPGMSGHALARLMREAPYLYTGRLVALTGYGRAADLAESQGAGFDAHLTKPVAPAQLLELVGRLAQARGL